MKAGLIICLIALLSAGCTLLDRQERRINYTETLDSNNTWDHNPSLITDAKQRAIINTKARVGLGIWEYKGKDGDFSGVTADDVIKNHPSRIICAEPSPDVAQAISAAFTAAATVDLKLAETRNISGSGSVGSSYVSSIAQLGARLSTVQLLRDKMYRACEAFQNGAISDTSYTLMLARFDKTMASMLASEIAAGAFGQKPAALGGSASTQGIDPKKLDEARVAVKDASQQLQDAVNNLPETDNEAKERKKKAIAAAGKNLNDAVTDLVLLEFKSSVTAAQSGPVAGDTLGLIQNGRGFTSSPEEIALIHANFLDDDASGTLIDACVVALDRNRAAGAVDETIKPLLDRARSQVDKQKDIAEKARVEAEAAKAEAKKAEAKKAEAKARAEGGSDSAFGTPAVDPAVIAATEAAAAAAAAAATKATDKDEARAELTEARKWHDQLTSLSSPSLGSICASMLRNDDLDNNFLLKLQERKLQHRMAGADLLTKQILFKGCFESTKDIPDQLVRAEKYIDCLSKGSK